MEQSLQVPTHRGRAWLLHQDSSLEGMRDVGNALQAQCQPQPQDNPITACRASIHGAAMLELSHSHASSALSVQHLNYFLPVFK